MEAGFDKLVQRVARGSEVPDYNGLNFKELLAAAPLEGIDLSRSKELPRNIEF